MRAGAILAAAFVLSFTLLTGCASYPPSPRAASALGYAPVPCAPDPHSSVPAFVSTHLDPEAWREYVEGDWVERGGARLPLTLAGAALVASPFDKQAERRAKGMFGDREAIGDAGLYGLVTGSMLLGVLSPRDGRSARDEGWARAEAHLVTLGITEGLKAAVKRRRPGDSGSRSSFPSGHASAAFCAATLLDRGNGHSWGYPAYAVATLTALSRLDANRHFPSDVLAGAAIGTAVAGIVDSLHFGDGSRGRGISPGAFAFEVEPLEDGRLSLSLGVDL